MTVVSTVLSLVGIVIFAVIVAGCCGASDDEVSPDEETSTGLSGGTNPGSVLVYQQVGNIGGREIDNVHTYQITTVQGTSYSATHTMKISASGGTTQEQVTYPGDGPRLFISPDNPQGSLGRNEILLGQISYNGNPYSNGKYATNNALATTITLNTLTYNYIYDGQSGVLLAMEYDNSVNEKWTMYLA